MVQLEANPIQRVDQAEVDHHTTSVAAYKDIDPIPPVRSSRPLKEGHELAVRN
jgi:hypothetical protein